MGPNGFMGTSLLALQISSSSQKCLHLPSFSRRCIPKNVKRFPAFTAHNFISAGHIRFLQLKKIGPKSVLERQKKTTACLKQSTLGICIRTSISWQCKLLSKELWMTYTHKSLKPHRLWLILFSDNAFSIRYIPKTGGVNNLQANVAFTIFAPQIYSSVFIILRQICREQISPNPFFVQYECLIANYL